MTLSIEQVRGTQFHLVRRGGYHPNEVDTFVDAVELTMAEHADEVATLQKQIEALKAGGFEGGDSSGGQEGAANSEEVARLTSELEALRAEQQRGADENERLRGELSALSGGGDEVAHLRGELDARASEVNELREQLGGKDAELGNLRTELEQARAELEEARGRLESADVEGLKAGIAERASQALPLI